MAQVDVTGARSGTDGAKPRLLSIQYLRGLAALSVLVTHVLQWPLATMNVPMLKTGRLGVEVFFVLSGFIMTVVAGSGRIDPVAFLRRRAVRIVPAYWAATVLITVLALAMPGQFRTTVPTVEGFVKSLLFIPSVEPKAPLLLLGWTLDYEAFFYVAFAALFFLRSEARTLALCAAFGGLIALGLTLAAPGHLVAFYTSQSLVGFLAGALLGQAYRHGTLPGRGWILAAGTAAMLTVAFYVVPWPAGSEVSFPVHLVMTAAAVAIVAASLRVEAAGRLPTLASLKALGDASYSVYLFHMFPVAALWALGRRVLDVGAWPTYAALAALAIAAGLAFGQLGYRLVEKPWLDGRRPWRAAPAQRVATAR